MMIVLNNFVENLRKYCAIILAGYFNVVNKRIFGY